ncbi:hypothetical protein O6H91_12G042400 [Diphasiastrum complanatum]|nr:hypothetical protein O6H91_12G042400 [Diphasiastrum complanatum]
MEFGLPSSHTINTICLSMYLLRYLSRHLDEIGSNVFWLTAVALSAIVVMVAYGRMYLGMHTPVDIAAGIVIGISLLVFWCSIEDYVDLFILQGENVLSFWTSISLLLLAAYPAPAQPTPSFEYHTAFTGVVLGVVWATYRMKHYLPTEVLFMGTWAGSLLLIKRLLIGLPIVLTTKTISKALVILIFPWVCAWAGVSIRSSSYISKLNGHGNVAKRGKVDPSNTQESLESKKNLCWLKLCAPIYQEPLDIDTGIRLFQYAVLSWSVVELAPYIFERLNL